VDFEMLEVWLSAQTYLVLYGPQSERSQLRFGGEAELLEPDDSVVILDGEGAWERLAPLFQLRHRKVAKANVSSQGTLSIQFDDGHRLVVAPDESYEAWELSGPADLNLVCPPGGGDPRIAGGLPPLK
jgi:hypothetical protein